VKLDHERRFEQMLLGIRQIQISKNIAASDVMRGQRNGYSRRVSEPLATSIL
jgi:hypothetical protein